MLDNAGIRYLYLDITESLGYLKKFLAIRDFSKAFDEIKEAGKIGLPALVINNGEEIVFDIENYDLEKLK